MKNIYKLPNNDLELGDYPYIIDPEYTTIIWHVVHICNLHCSYCTGYGSKHESLLTIIGEQELLDAFIKVKEYTKRKLMLCCTGGEPSIVKNYGNFCAKLSDNGFILQPKTNLIGNESDNFINKVNPANVALIEAALHPQPEENENLWKLFFTRAKKAHNLGFNIVIKYIATPYRINTLNARIRKIEDAVQGQIPILISPYLAGTTWPKMYSNQQIDKIMNICNIRKTIFIHRWKCTNSFKGMKCDSGRGVIMLQVTGEFLRCWNARNGRSYGTLQKGILNLDPEPLACPYSRCACTQQAMCWGLSPWNHIKDAKKEQCYYNRFVGNINKCL